jgi:hypothetical protein
MKKRLILFTTVALLVVSLLVIVFRGKVNTGFEVFLPGYKYGLPLEKIDNENVRNFVKLSSDFGDKSSLYLIVR